MKPVENVTKFLYQVGDKLKYHIENSCVYKVVEPEAVSCGKKCGGCRSHRKFYRLYCINLQKYDLYCLGTGIENWFKVEE